MNILKEIKVSTRFKSIKKCYSSVVGSVDKITDIYLPPRQQSIKKINQLDKGNAKQLSKIGLVHKHGSGFYSLMPFLFKSYAKLVRAIEHHMNRIGGQRILLPSLYQIEMLKESDRFDLLKSELFMLQGRNNKQFYLAPTHEEAVTSIISSNPLNHKQLPILLYQIDSKFRNELRPRFGLLRANQFIMKDLYSFDIDQDSALRTYEKVCQSYVDLFNYLGLDFVKVVASNGLMGGQFSHEFHLISKYGEDDIYQCDDCNKIYNKEILIDFESVSQEKGEKIQKLSGEEDVKIEIKICPECKHEMKHRNSIEIGHTFYLGTKYSAKMNACFSDKLEINKEDEVMNENVSKKKPLEMCCFGIGVTRILSAFISQQAESIGINWPLRIAPYHVLIIPPKKGSKQDIDEIGTKMAEHISNELKLKGFDVLIDNRSYLTIGRRQIDSLAYGFPYKIIIGKESTNELPKFELHTKDEQKNLTHSELLNKFDEIIKIL